MGRSVGLAHLYNIVLKSKYPVIIEQLFCIRVVETSALNILY